MLPLLKMTPHFVDLSPDITLEQDAKILKLFHLKQTHQTETELGQSVNKRPNKFTYFHKC